MTRPDIALQPPQTDTVTAVLRFIDGYSRRPVSRGVTAVLWDPVREAELPFRLIRNLSGQLVLLNQPSDVMYTFVVDPSDAGYQVPPPVTFTPDVDGIRSDVPLSRRPDFAFEDRTTLVRGVVVRSAGGAMPAATAAVPNLMVSLVVKPPAPAVLQPPAPAPVFTTMTDERGAFALPVRLPQDTDGEELGKQQAILMFGEVGDPDRQLEVTLTDGRSHSFDSPIDLDQTTEPGFAPGQN